MSITKVNDRQPKSLAQVYNLVWQTDPRDRKAVREAAELLFGFRSPRAGRDVENAQRMPPIILIEGAGQLQESELVGAA